MYDQADAAGFIRLYGLPLRVAALKEREASNAAQATVLPLPARPRRRVREAAGGDR